MIIAIDGPAASGKGTLARRLAKHLNYAYLDTGLIYRAVASKMLAATSDGNTEGECIKIAKSMRLADLQRSELRNEEVGLLAAEIASIPTVRQALLGLQRRFAAAPPGGEAGAVLDGRDIGTVVCPEAEVKIFVTASLVGRARRRHKQLLERGEASIYARVVQEMRARDGRDSERAAAPLRPAPDAVVLDTNELDAEDSFRAALEIVDSRRAGLTPGARTTK